MRPNKEALQTLSILMSGFSLLILSGYFILWSTSNKNLTVITITAALFLIGIGFSPQRAVTVGSAFLFAGIRWIIGAISTADVRAIVAACVFFSVPVAIVAANFYKNRAPTGRKPER